jgi:endogenous inhibitor of DNA gyrase (YacG/DUF329 family)
MTDKIVSGTSVKVNCSACGKELTRSASKAKRCKRFFCDYKCAGTWRQGENNPRYTESITASCAVCGKSVERFASQHKRNQANLCSRECYAEYRSRKYVGEYASRWEGATLDCACEHCGTSFKRGRSQIKGQIFCSKQCDDDHHAAIKSCATCGESVRVSAHNAKRWDKAFCDHECYSVWKSANIAGENHPNWRGGFGRYYGPNWPAQRRKALERDGYRCQVCNRMKGQEGTILHIHHIIPFRVFGYAIDENDNYLQANTLENLITCCQWCHSSLEPRTA